MKIGKMTVGMMRSYNSGRKKHLRMVLPLLMVFVWLTSISCYKKPAEGSILVVQEAKGKDVQSELVLIDPRRPDRHPLVLVKEFHEVASPEISYHGDAVVIQPKK